MSKELEKALEKAGVFKGADGLRRLCDAHQFWEEQPYGTRLYFGGGVTDYLHRDVLRAVINVADTFLASQQEERCDGTGDVHRTDGEWLGECDCQHPEHPEQADGAQGEREAAIAKFAETCPMTSESAASGNSYDLELRRYYLLGWDDRAALAQPSTSYAGFPKPTVLKDCDVRYAANAASAAVNPGEPLPGCISAQPSPAPELERLDSLESWASALLDMAVLQEALTSRDSAERLKNMNAGEVMRRAFGKLKEIRAQHERIVGALRAELELQGDYQQKQQAVIHQLQEERDAALAKLAAMEQQEPIGEFRESEYDGEPAFYWIDAIPPVGTKLYAAPVAQAGQVPEGMRLVPFNPTEDQWGGIARAIVFWMRSYPSNKHTPATLVEFITSLGHAVPEWMGEETELRATDHVISKGTIAVLIYKAMLAAAPQPAKGDAP